MLLRRRFLFVFHRPHKLRLCLVLPPQPQPEHQSAKKQPVSPWGQLLIPREGGYIPKRQAGMQCFSRIPSPNEMWRCITNSQHQELQNNVQLVQLVVLFSRYLMPFSSALLILIFFATTFDKWKSNIFTRFMKGLEYKFQWDNCHQYFTFIWDNDEWYSCLQKRVMSKFYSSNYLTLHFNLILVTACWVPPRKASVKGFICYVVQSIISSRLGFLIPQGLFCRVQHGLEPRMLLQGSTTQRCWPHGQYNQGQDIALDMINSPSEQTQRALFCSVL